MNQLQVLALMRTKGLLVNWAHSFLFLLQVWPVIRLHGSVWVLSCRFTVANGTLWDTELICLSSSKCFDLFHQGALLFAPVSPGWSLFLSLSFLSLPHLLYFTAPISYIISSLSNSLFSNSLCDYISSSAHRWHLHSNLSSKVITEISYSYFPQFTSHHYLVLTDTTV